MAEITSSIEFQMSLLLFVALTGYQLAARINQSAVVGEILVGLAVGPSFLKLITYTDFVSAIAHLGAVILLFVVGLEFKMREVYNPGYLPIALVGVGLPWVSGYLMADFFGYGIGAAMFVGTALSATSIAISAQVFKEMGKLHSPAVKAIIGAAVIDDILSLLALSLTEQFVAGSISPAILLGAGVKAGGFLLLGSLIGHQVLTRHMLKIDRSDIGKRYPEFIFIYAMMVAFFYSMIAELLGLSAIVGAFIAGISLEGINRLKHSKDYKEGADYLRIIFASIFFVSLGILVNIQEMRIGALWFLIFLSVVALLSKLVGCSLPAKLQGMSSRDSLTIGFGMAPRGEVAMVVALIGLNQGYIHQDIYISLVIMALITTLIPPIGLRRILKG